MGHQSLRKAKGEVEPILQAAVTVMSLGHLRGLLGPTVAPAKFCLRMFILRLKNSNVHLIEMPLATIKNI